MAQEIADSKLIDTWSSDGLKVKPDISKIIEGWQLGEQPPHEYMNWLQNTFGSKLNHILKNGVASWNNTTQYLAGSSVQHNGNVWLCKTTNTNSAPTDANANWKRIITVESLTTVLNGYVALTGDQTIAGVKTFSSNPLSTATQSTNSNALTKYSAVVKNTGDETIAGVKTFSSTISGSISGNAATVTNGVYTTGNQTIAGVKTFSSSPIVPTPTTDFQSATKQYVDYTSTQYTTYGLGTEAKLNNLFNSFLDTGFYKQSTGGDSPNNYSTILKLKHATNADADLLFVHTTPSVIIKARTSISGTRNSWVELKHTGNEQQIGVGQTYQDVTASRALGVTYTNTTGKPIMVSATVQGSGAGTTTATGYVNGVKACTSWASYGSTGVATGSSVEFIVPNGATYYVNQSGSSSTSLSNWAELR